MCRCTPSIRTPWCGKPDCAAPISQHLPPEPWGHIRMGIDPPKSVTPPSFDDMRKQILAASRDSALINSCLRTAEMLGLSGEDRYVVLSYYSLVELERQYRFSVQHLATTPSVIQVRAPSEAACSVTHNERPCLHAHGHSGPHYFGGGL